MAQTPYPYPKETRETAVLSGTGAATYGPFGFRIFDTADVRVFVRPAGADYFEAAAVTVTKTVDAAFDTFSITFPAAAPSTTQFIVRAERVHERQIAVTKGGSLSTDQLEKELSKQGTVVEELRRDINRGGAVAPGEDGEGLMFEDGRIVPGPNLPAEAIAWRAADQQLQQNINTEAQTRLTTDLQLQQNINAEAATRLAADQQIINTIGMAYISDDHQAVTVAIAPPLIVSEGASPYPHVTLEFLS